MVIVVPRGRHVRRVGCLTTGEPDEFAGTGDVTCDLLAIAAVHPLRETAVDQMLRDAGADRSVLDALVGEGRLLPTQYAGERFYRIPAPQRRAGARHEAEKETG